MIALDADAAAGVAKSLHARLPSPATLTIFGAAGDLTKRLIVPALYHLVRAGKLPDGFAIIGVDHNDQTTEGWCQNLTEMMQAAARGSDRQGGTIDEQAWSWLIRRMHYVRGDFTQPETYSRLEKLLTELRRQQEDTANVLFYLATTDRFFGPVIEQLGRAGLTRQSEKAWRRVIIEKPFGHDLPSAEALNAQLLKVAVRGPDLSHRSLPRQGNGPEYPGTALRQRHLRAAVEPRPYRPCPDHGRRDSRRRGPRSLLRKDRRIAGHGAEPSVSAPCHDRYGAADLIRCGCRARQEDGAVPGNSSHLTGQCCTWPVRGGRGARQKRSRLPARARCRAEFRNRNLCRAQARHRQLALGRRAILPPHRQAPFRPHDRDRGAISSSALCTFPRHPGRSIACEHPDAPHPTR